MLTIRKVVGSLILASLLGAVQTMAQAQEGVAPGHRCAKDEQGNVFCSRFSGGDAFIDLRTKNVVCGKGHCLVDYNKQGSISCARTANGVAAYDKKAAVVCSGGCEPATNAMCEKLTP